MLCNSLAMFFKDCSCQRLRQTTTIVDGHVNVTDGGPVKTNQRLQMRITIHVLDRLDRTVQFNVNYFYRSQKSPGLSICIRDRPNGVHRDYAGNSWRYTVKALD